MQHRKPKNVELKLIEVVSTLSRKTSTTDATELVAVILATINHILPPAYITLVTHIEKFALQLVRHNPCVSSL